MDKKLKKLWIKALRSGRYQRGKGALKDDGKYCCLGVLANIQGANWKALDNTFALTPFIEGACAGKIGSEGGLLRPKFAGGLSTVAQAKLANMNDGGASFKEIADYIEKKL